MGIVGSTLAVLSAAICRLFLGPEEVEIYSWQAVAVIVEAVFFGACAPLTPLSECTKIYLIQLTASYMIQLFRELQTSVWRLCAEYLLMSLFGAGCIVLAYLIPLPKTLGGDVYALHGAATAFEAVVDGCAEILSEATSVFGGDKYYQIFKYCKHIHQNSHVYSKRICFSKKNMPFSREKNPVAACSAENIGWGSQSIYKHD